MFGFFTKIKTEITNLKAKFEALEAKVEAYFGDVKTDAVKEVAVVVDTSKDAAKVVEDVAKADTPKAE